VYIRIRGVLYKVARSFRHRPTKGTSAFIPGMGMEELQPNALRSSGKYESGRGRWGRTEGGDEARRVGN
jgi:hypothetical protein